MRIGIVNDMPMALELLRRLVASTAGYEVAWLAEHGDEALQKCLQDTPDLVLMDLVMPGMDGAETTRQIMQQCPCAVLVVTASVRANQSLAFEALSAGAIDVVKIPSVTGETSPEQHRLWKKIHNISQLVRHEEVGRPASGIKKYGGMSLFAIGASTGGPKAVSTLLSAFPEHLSAAVIVVMHVDQQFARGMARWMAGFSKLPVRTAAEDEAPAPGEVLLAATNDHLTLGYDGCLHYQAEPLACHYRPSVDVFFSSLVQHWPAEAVGVLLTGMGRDGAAGLKAMREHGWHTIAQDEKTSVIYGMPRAAAEIGAAGQILALDRIGPELVRLLRQQGKGG